MNSSKLTWRSAGLTDRGKVRSDNQDNFYISEDSRVFVVADGVGGSVGGALASKLAVETVEDKWNRSKKDGMPPSEIQAWMGAAVAEANQRMRDAACENKSLEGMGTTIVMAIIDDDGRLHVGHAGDSRASMVRDGKTKTLTIDHSVVMEMHIKGQLSLEQCRNNPYRHLITRCLGHDDEVEIDYGTHEVESGDYIVLASDGLADVMLEDDIGDLVDKCIDADMACDMLLQKVLMLGAPDNVTIVVVGFQEAGVKAKEEELLHQ